MNKPTSTPPPASPVILRRLDALEDAIRDRDWDHAEWCYDQVRSAVERGLGVRNRPYDPLRGQHR